MRILLFDWYSGGHHEGYLEAFANALVARHEVVVAAPPASAAAAARAGVEFQPIEKVSPTVDTAQRLSRNRVRTLGLELDLLATATERARADHVVHMFADSALRRLARRRLDRPTTLVLFRPRAHWRALGGLPPTLGERSVGTAYELALARWRRRAEAHAILTLDELAARRWSRMRGAPAYWLPEPPVARVELPPTARGGAILFGSIAERKGIQHLAGAFRKGGCGVSLTLVGALDPAFTGRFDVLVEELRRSGVELDLRLHHHEERAALALLSAAQVAVLPYVGHVGMSRVLLEAAACGTPVVAHDSGLLGHLVRTRNLGAAVDCRDPSALAAAIRGFLGDPGAPERHAAALRDFAAGYDSDRFADAVLAPFDTARTNRPSN
ncbi:MAG: glycosyltransferase [Gaiellaceae bacterium]